MTKPMHKKAMMSRRFHPVSKMAINPAMRTAADVSAKKYCPVSFENKVRFLAMRSPSLSPVQLAVIRRCKARRFPEQLREVFDVRVADGLRDGGHVHMRPGEQVFGVLDADLLNVVHEILPG